MKNKNNEIEMCCDNPKCIAEHLRNKMTNKNIQKEFNLSEWREKVYTGDIIEGCEEWYWKYPEDKVKEFIRLLKEMLGLNDKEKFMSSFVVKNSIEHLAGDKLNEK